MGGHPECTEMLRGAGARVVEGSSRKASKFNTRVQIPAHLVEDAIHSAPKSVTIITGKAESQWC